MQGPAIRRAILSVSDKTGLAEFAQALAAGGVELYSTGGTRRFLEDAGLTVRDIAEYTGFPEMMDGRLKTLHPKIFGGILSRRDRADDMQAMESHGILPFELVVVNLYPFEQTIAKPGVRPNDAIEQIDIGGPSLVRAAAKNHAFVTIATRAAQYPAILDEFRKDGSTTLPLRRRLMIEAYAHTGAYDALIAQYYQSHWSEEPFPETLPIALRRTAELRYGENPHQRAAVYQLVGEHGSNLVSARQLAGKELSYNNLLDLDSALAIVRQFSQPAATVIKHNNPCGAALGATLAEAARRGMEGDPQSAFGSVLGFNRPVDAETAEYLSTPGLFVEAIVAPAFEPAALEILTTRPKWRSNVRLMETGPFSTPGTREYRRIEGGLLVQDSDQLPDPEPEWRVVTKASPTDKQLEDLRFGWSIVRFVKSNAIVVCKDQTLWGAGAGQMSRVDSVEIALRKAEAKLAGCVLASDAFFPFPDSIDRAAQAGISAVIQPGGSKNDDQVIAACDRHGIAMIFTGRRHFKH
ncbi:MAG: Bifunctional purine biosynthesis protein PurH [Planctomycetota bacterium]|jgi:phosphoribosylaminoimidazolecarboxamide formyltransferase/IMP cyclohydrolase